MAAVLERTFTSRSTPQKIEAGDTSVGIGIYAGVPQALGLLDGLTRPIGLARSNRIRGAETILVEYGDT